MDFHTLHELARELDRPERVIRYRFHALRKLGRLEEGRDYVREDFVDEQHCVYKIHPLRFMNEAKMRLPSQVDNAVDNKAAAPVSQVVDGDREPGISRYPQEASPVNLGERIDSNGANTSNQAIEGERDHGNDFHSRRDTEILSDYVETLKEQLRVKDSQIEGYRTEISAQGELMRGTVGELLKAQEQVRLLTVRTSHGFDEEPKGSDTGYDGDRSEERGVRDARRSDAEMPGGEPSKDSGPHSSHTP